jgi:subfamily B ATP-binding cassette protein MsbA
MLNVAILTAVSRYLLKPVIDEVFSYKDTKQLSLLVFAIPGVYLLNGIFVYLKNYITIYIANNVVKNLRQDTYKRLQTISIDYFIVKSSTGKTISKLTNDLNNIFLMLSKTPSVLVTDLITIIGLIFVLFYLSVKFAILSLLVLPIALFPIYIFSKKLRYYSKKTQSEIANLYKNLQESISAISLTKMFNQEKREIENFNNINTKVYSAILKFSRTELLSSPIMEFIGAIGVAVVLFLGGNDVINGRWTAGGFFAFLAAALSFYQPLKRVAEVNPLLQQGIVSLERVFGIIEQQSSVVEVANSVEAKFSKLIKFNKVSFSYDGKKEVIKNINLEIPFGKKVALVGPSGAGKSTILNLLLRFYDVNSGEILIDDVNIKNFSLNSLRKLFGVVTQDTFLFNDTLRYNITYGKPDASEEEIVRVTKMAHIYDTIQKLPQKFDTVVGERGYALSGGERQRIAIARALLIDPKIFIFDEPTSALDAESESIVMQAIENATETKTVLLITHRLNLVTHYDYIYVFSNGEIIEQGTHQELLKIEKFYNSLINLQQIKQE